MFSLGAAERISMCSGRRNMFHITVENKFTFGFVVPIFPHLSIFFALIFRVTCTRRSKSVGFVLFFLFLEV